MWDAFTYPLLNLNGAIVEVLEWISNIIPDFTGHVLLIHAEIKDKPC